MSKSSIYESHWTNLVFENRNKEYGAYQLRQETTKTSLLALAVSLSLCAILILVPKVVHQFYGNTLTATESTPPLVTEITPVNLAPKMEEKKPEPLQTTTETKPQIISKKETSQTLKNPIVVPTALATQDIPTNEILTPTIDPNAIIGNTASVGTGNGSDSTGNTTGTGNGIDSGNTIVNTTALDKQPAFPGGIEKFYMYVGRHFETPEINDDKNLRILVYFVVEKDGSMTDIQVKNTPGHDLAEEAIRVLKSIKTKWSPGIIDAKPVRTAYTLPITIQVN
ncbi:energy transducer TonB [Flavobacterium sp. UMI-01]|uniref:energy transducer TonB n=1 Tax=Flavobacterium sp. UMI-01 TaxID=1441053 RepID=UPI001C7CC434|nr:energy transducer TonB [Flavobacterium sp. UMI-01]GIZ10322.1 hypothetical protein FUMI01_30460 [Flavobacterium sp. UMI-01]